MFFKYQMKAKKFQNTKPPKTHGCHYATDIRSEAITTPA